MSDFLKKFKSVFIVEDGATPTPATPTPNQPANAPTPTAPAQQATAGAVTDKFTNILLGALEKNNQGGFDYFEFRQALLNLAKMPMDEATRFQSAYAMAQTMGVTPPVLIESARFYLTVLTDEQGKFNDAHAQQRTKLIGGREDEIKSLETAIQQKTEQIKQLQQDIEQAKVRSEQLRKEMEESTLKIENTKADFDATFAAVVAQIQGDVAKIQQYLKG